MFFDSESINVNSHTSDEYLEQLAPVIKESIENGTLQDLLEKLNASEIEQQDVIEQLLVNSKSVSYNYFIFN